MIQKMHDNIGRLLLGLVGACMLALLGFVHITFALTPLPTPEPKPGAYGLEATKKKAPPSRGATITTPGNGASFSTSPITVNGICPNGLLVQVYNNGVMVGAVMCENGSFSVQVSLFAGTNELTAEVYDEVDQKGPASNKVTVNYRDTDLAAFGDLVTLTSSFGRRSAAAGTTLNWPLQLSGGAGPYAFSIDWGDGTKPELKSQATAGVVTIDHVYKNAGIYRVNVTVTDTNGASAFLQLIAVANGEVNATAATTNSGDQPPVVTRVMWVPAAIALALLVPTYWIGRRSQLVSLRNKMIKDRDAYKQT